MGRRGKSSKAPFSFGWLQYTLNMEVNPAYFSVLKLDSVYNCS
jgi:hypothetical protein